MLVIAARSTDVACPHAVSSQDRAALGSFTPRSTRAISRSACRQQAVDSLGGEMLCHGENAVYRLARLPTVVRVARHAHVAFREAAVAAWLASTVSRRSA